MKISVINMILFVLFNMQVAIAATSVPVKLCQIIDGKIVCPLTPIEPIPYEQK